MVCCKRSGVSLSSSLLRSDHGALGFRILHYLDSWLILASSYDEIALARDKTLASCQELGIYVTVGKSCLILLGSILSGDNPLKFDFKGFSDPGSGSDSAAPDGGIHFG